MSSAQEDCIFCKKINCKVLEETKYFFIIRDTAYPVTEYHTFSSSSNSKKFETCLLEIINV